MEMKTLKFESLIGSTPVYTIQSESREATFGDIDDFLRSVARAIETICDAHLDTEEDAIRIIADITTLRNRLYVQNILP